ncbi:hypothetical protein NBRC116602_20450 [Hyphomicrobiales bacterium 4NK60-0047b]
MNKLSIISMTTLIFAILGGTVAKAADLDYYETRDRSYIDRTLDDFERKTGQRPTYKNEYKNDYEDERYKSHKERFDNKHNRYEQEKNWRRHCLPKRKIRRTLIKRGWHDFHILKERPRRIKLLATNYNGRRFKLVLNACTGHIIRRIPMRKYWGWN